MARTTIEAYATTEEVADFLNKPLSWLHHTAGPLGIPRRKIGNQWRYRLSEVEAWVEGRA